MARLFTCGFEENDFTGTMWNGGTATIQTGVVRSGTYALECLANDTSPHNVIRFLSSVVTSGTFFTRGYYRWTANPSADLTLSIVGGTVADSWAIRLLTTGAIRLINLAAGGTTVATSAVLSTNTWYRIEVRHLLSDTVGELELRIDGVFIGAVSGVDTLATNIDNWGFGKIGTANHGAIFYIDDIAINDEAGVENSWPGEGRIILVKPSTNVTNQWEDETSGGSTFANVDELPGTPDDVNYNVEAVTLNSIDRFGLSTIPAVMNADDFPLVLHVFARVGSNQTATTSGRFKIWDHNGVLTNGAVAAFGVNGWRILSITGGGSSEPVTSRLWGLTKANVQNFNIGYENITDDPTLERRVSTFWANLEYRTANFLDLGTLGNNASRTLGQSSIVLTTTAVAEAGRLVIVVLACDNNATVNGDEGAVSSITDSAGGNTWTKIREFCNSNGAAKAGCTVSVWRSILTNQIASGGTITFNLTNSTSRDSVSCLARKFAIRTGYTLVVEASTDREDDAVDPGAITLSSLQNAEHLFIHAMAAEGPNNDAYTWAANYTQFATPGTP